MVGRNRVCRQLDGTVQIGRGWQGGKLVGNGLVCFRIGSDRDIFLYWKLCERKPPVLQNAPGLIVSVVLDRRRRGRRKLLPRVVELLEDSVKLRREVRFVADHYVGAGTLEPIAQLRVLHE